MKNFIRILILFFLLNKLSISQGLGNWELFGTMPIPTYSGAAVSNDSIIFIFGGISDSLNRATDLIQRYNPNTTNKWSVSGHLKYTRSGLSAGISNQNIFLFGGVEDIPAVLVPGHIEKIDLNNPVNSVIIDSIFNFYRFFSTGLQINDKCYVIGGFDLNRSPVLPSPYIVEYDLNSKTTFEYFSSTFTNILPELQMSSAIGDSIFIFGGSYNTLLNSIYLYNTQSKTLENVSINLLTPRANGIAVRIPNTKKILIIGGYNELNTLLKTTEIFEVTDSGFTIKPGPQINIGRTGLMSAVIDNYIYILGGVDENYLSVSAIERVHYDSTVDVSDDYPVLLEDFKLYQNYPNPFNPSTKISWHSSFGSYQTLKIYDILGNEIVTLLDEYLPAGKHDIIFDSQHMPGDRQLTSGVYFYKLTSNKFVNTKKMILLH